MKENPSHTPSSAKPGDDLNERIVGLSPAKRALLELRLKQKSSGASREEVIPRRTEPGPAPLSFAQERLWFLEQFEPDGFAYNRPVAVRLAGPLDAAALERSLNEILERHEALRTTFPVSEGRPVQVIARPRPLDLPVVDLGGLAEGKRESEVSRLTREDARRPFNLAQGPLLRASLLRLGAEEHVLLLTMHHIVSDGWSDGVLFRELAVLYEAFSEGKLSPLPELPIQYADFAAWQREWLRGEVLESRLSYWKRQLEGVPTVLELPTDRPRPPLQTTNGATQTYSLSKALSAALKELSRREGVTLFMTLLAAFQTLLHRYTGQYDILVGAPIAGRNRIETEGLIGCFINTLILRTDHSGDPTFKELLGRVREMALGAYAHQDLPFEKLVEELKPERDMSRTPLFQVMFQLRNIPDEPVESSGLKIEDFESDSGIAKVDLTLEIAEKAEGLSCVFEYNTDLFDAATIGRMQRHLKTLLEGIVASPEQRLSELPLLTKAERHRMLVEWNDTRTDYPKDRCIHKLFEEQVKRTPESVAAEFEGEQLTYRELNTRANQLAHHLRKLGVGPEALVGICTERSLEMVVGLLGILKAGGAYVPLDPAYPKERLSFMIEDAQAPMVLTQERLVGGLPKHVAQLVLLDADWAIIAQEGEENPDSEATSDNLAYVIYTSGSTGRSKGVAIEHRSTVALLRWAREVFTPEQLGGVLASTSICFDLSVFELFVPLSWGGGVILAENGLQLPSLPAAEKVTLINMVPSAIAELVRTGGVPDSVRTVNLGGEPLRTSLVRQIYQQGGIEQVFDLYGPSEDTTYSTFALRSGTRPATIGRPISNTQVYILDRHLQPVPVGVPGELHVGGDSLARGYLNRPELTAEKFIPDPFSDRPGARLYKTGDLARYRPNGDIEYLARLDHQVKIRGFRIEPGEIEATLDQHPAVRETVVVAQEDEPGEKRLVAYVVLDQGRWVQTGELRRHIKAKLPEYMVPSAFVTLDTMPLTPNGKVDRCALPTPDPSSFQTENTYAEPRSPVEEMLSGIWEEVLGLKRVGIHDDFFELGGHSLLATQVISRLRDAMQVELPLRCLFETPTVAGLAERIAAVRRSDPTPSMAVLSSDDLDDVRL